MKKSQCADVDTLAPIITSTNIKTSAIIETSTTIKTDSVTAKSDAVDIVINQSIVINVVSTEFDTQMMQTIVRMMLMILMELVL